MNKFTVMSELQKSTVKTSTGWGVYYNGVKLGKIINKGVDGYKVGKVVYPTYMKALAYFVTMAMCLNGRTKKKPENATRVAMKTYNEVNMVIEKFEEAMVQLGYRLAYARYQWKLCVRGDY